MAWLWLSLATVATATLVGATTMALITPLNVNRWPTTPLQVYVTAL
jgi:hypothetical protein